jgi:GPH family glycoside/pentoside/hexuronide:cation symporter
MHGAGIAVAVGVALLARHRCWASSRWSRRSRRCMWFGITMVGLFSAFSFLTISMYAEGVRAAGHLGACRAPEASRLA